MDISESMLEMHFIVELSTYQRSRKNFIFQQSMVQPNKSPKIAYIWSDFANQLPLCPQLFASAPRKKDPI